MGNHLLDCRVYNLALAEYLGLQKLTSDEWAMLGRERGAPAGETLPLWSAAGPVDRLRLRQNMPSRPRAKPDLRRSAASA